MYAKLKLTMEEYNQLKQNILLYTSSADFSTISNIKRMHGYKSIDMDDYVERFVAADVYGESFTTGETYYMLIQETTLR